jgi:hypothetical protein
VNVNTVEIGIRGQYVGRNLLPLGGVPIAHFLDDGDVLVFIDDIVEAIAAQLADVLAEVAGDFQHLALGRAVFLGQLIHHHFSGLLACQAVVREDGHIDLASGRRAVDRVEGDAGLFGLLNGRADTGAVFGNGDDRVHAERNEIIDVVVLLLRIGVGIGRHRPTPSPGRYPSGSAE